MTDLSTRPDSVTSPEMVRWAFRTILGHHVVSDDVVRRHQQAFPRFDQLCEALKDSNEFAVLYGPRSAPQPPGRADASDADLRTIITSLYRAYLHRAPDAVGLAHNLALLKQMNGLSGVGDLATVFEKSTERALHDLLATCMRWITSSNGQAEEFEGRPIISLGSHCAPSMMLKKNELKHFSGPFDWIFSTPAMVRHCMTDRFRTFLNPKYHLPANRINETGGFDEVADHAYYRDHFSTPGLVFNHRDITRPEVLQYYRRCVARFSQMLKDRQPVYFLQCVVAGHHDYDACIEEFRATADLLKDVAPEASLAMFYIRLKGGIMPELRVLDERDNHRLFQLDSVSVLGALDFHEQIDQVCLMRALRWHARTRSPAVIDALQEVLPH